MMNCVWDEKNCLFCTDNEKTISLHEAEIAKFLIFPEKIRVGLRLSDCVNSKSSPDFVWLNFESWRECSFDCDTDPLRDDWFNDSILSVEKNETGFQIWMELLWSIQITSDMHLVTIEPAYDFELPRFEISKALKLNKHRKPHDPDNAAFTLPSLLYSVSNQPNG